MIRVLIADASSDARRIVREILGGDPNVAVVGEAADGYDAIRMTKRLRPDAVIVDTDLPGLNGFQTTKQMMIEVPTSIVIVSAMPSAQHAEVSMLALRAGALAVLPKPNATTATAHSEECERFVSTVKAMSQVKLVRHWPTRDEARPRPKGNGSLANAHSRLIAIAASTGGPAALQSILSQFPPQFPVPIVVVQHIARGFAEGFAAWLGTVCSLAVRVAEDGDAFEARTVYVAPDDCHLGISPRRTVLLSNAPPIGGFRPSATFLFETAAKACGRGAVAVVLTGMGRDGAEGLRAIRSAGGRVIVQDEASSVVFGMPAAAIESGQVDAVMPLPAIAPQLMNMV